MRPLTGLLQANTAMRGTTTGDLLSNHIIVYIRRFAMLFETSLYNDPDKAARSSREKMPLILAEFLVDTVNPLHGSLFDPCCDTSSLLSAPEAFDYILLNPPFHYDKEHGYLDAMIANPVDNNCR